MIYIRTDANTTIASGHIMRCLVIARQVKKLGENVCFLLSDEESKEQLLLRMETENEFPIKILDSDFQNPEMELPGLLRILEEEQAECLLVDSYYVTENYLKQISEQIRTIYIDDLQKFDYSVDTVINYDLQVDSSFYTQANNLYIGGKFAPIREMFSEVDYTVNPTSKHILISTGGTDKDGFAFQFLKQALERKNENLVFHILVGSMSTCKQELYRCAEENGNVRLYENVIDMASLMKQCDVAICAGGGTLYELCAVGVPTISFALSESQIPCLKAFESENIIPFVGRVEESDIIPKLYAKLMELNDNLIFRQQMSQKERKIVDGKGATRIAQILRLCYNKQIEIK